MIKLIRIDYRLIHGQVVFTWINNLRIQRVIVIDNRAANDETIRMTLEMSTPHDVKLNIFTVKDALNRKNKISKIKDNTAIIFGNVSECLSFMKEFNSPIKEINYGGIPNKDQSKEFDKAIFLTDEEVLQSVELINLGYSIYSQQTPTTKRKSLDDLLK